LFARRPAPLGCQFGWQETKTRQGLKIRVSGFESAPGHTAFLHMNIEEIAEVHNRIAFALRMSGLKGAALDEAIAAAFRKAARAIERERGIEWKRSKTMRRV